MLSYMMLLETYERIRTKFSANYAKQTQFFPIIRPKTTIPQKNKPNSKPIKANFGPKTRIKNGSKPNTNPIPKVRKQYLEDFQDFSRYIIDLIQ